MMSQTMEKEKLCPSYCMSYEFDEFCKCEFCDDIIQCSDCIKEHYEDKHVDPLAISKEEFDELDEVEI